MQLRIYARPVIGLLAVAFAASAQWHRATSRAPGMATRPAITPGNKEGQVHYQPDAAGGDNR